MARLPCILLLAVGFWSSAQASKKTNRLLQSLIWSDEYDQSERPAGAKAGDPTPVTVNIHIMEAHSLDERTSELSLTIYFRLYWKDSRLKFKKAGLNRIDLPDGADTGIWIPDVFFPTARSTSFVYAPAKNEMLRFSPEGDVIFSRSLRVKIPCRFDYVGFPMDTATCSLDIESYKAASEDLMMHWQTPTSARSEAMPNQPFRLTNVSQDQAFEDLATGRYQRMTMKLHLARNASHYVTQYYLPMIFFVLVAYIAIWISKSAIFARFMVLLADVIAMAAMSVATRVIYTDPNISGVTPMEVYGAVCYILVFFALIETAIVAVVEGNRKKNRDVMPLESTHLQTEPEEKKTNFRQSPRLPASLLSRIDVIARIGFIVVFIVFNVIYWLACAL